MKYYYAVNNEKIGPITIEELKKANINDETLVWFRGLEKWKKIKNIPELQSVFISEPSKQYYLLENSQKIGPFTIDELKEENIKPNTLVWSKNLNEWTNARKIDELEEIIMPPIPNQNFGSLKKK